MKLQFQAMLLLDAVICAFWIYYRVAVDVQWLPYPHFLVDYSFGFIRRGLVGEFFSVFYRKVPIELVFVFGAVSVLVALGLYVALFRRDFGLRASTLPLLAFTAGSPFFFKNFFYNLGYFDVLGCIVAIAALLLPANAVYPLLFACASIVLVLIHPLHVLLYVPTIGFIVLVRYGLANRDLRARRLGLLAVLSAAVLGAFAAVMIYGTPRVPQDELLAHMRSRAVDQFHTAFVAVWYSTAAQEVHNTWQRLGGNLLQAPAYLIVLALHWPLIRFARESWRAVGSRRERRVALWGMGAICAAYAVIFAMVFDYSRWTSSLLVCALLVLHAIRHLQSAQPVPGPGPSGGSGATQHVLLFAWLVTLVPRIGTVTPF